LDDRNVSHLVVTTIDERFYPGLVGLHNSFLKHSAEGFDFAAIVFGSDELADRVERRGIIVARNPEFPREVKRLPEGKHYLAPEHMPAMYGRLLIPDIFKSYGRSIYIDADSLILQSLMPLAEMEMRRPLAAPHCNSPMHYNVKGRDFKQTVGPMSSMYVTDHALWRDFRIDEKWIEAINDPTLSFPFTVQGVLQTAINLDWHELPWETQAHAGHTTFSVSRPGEVYSLHFMGTKPWEEIPDHLKPYQAHKIAARLLWSKYFCMS